MKNKQKRKNTNDKLETIEKWLKMFWEKKNILQKTKKKKQSQIFRKWRMGERERERERERNDKKELFT